MSCRKLKNFHSTIGSSSFLEKVALEELGELRKQLMAELATFRMFRNVIQAVEFPERGPGRTQSLADTERSTQNSGEDSERVFSRLESLVEALEARRRLRSRIDEVHEKKDAATSPVQPDGVSTGRLSEYRHAFDEEFSSSDPSSDPSIGQIRLEPLDLG
ncbi:unnamed protein product, partial [Mesorhabditis spiculigera]